MIKMDPIDKMFTEKYRPKKVDDVVGEAKNKIKKYLENPNAMPHFLFYSGCPGTGKTSMAKAIINELGCDALILNSSDDRKIEIIREKVKQFAVTKSTNGLRKCVFLDEFDGMLKASQNALRNIMETYCSNVFFILTCNSINKIIEPLKSRCVPIPFAYPDKVEVLNCLLDICNKENIKFTEDGLKALVENNYPSIRNCVLILQDLHTQNLSATIENIKPAGEVFEEMWQCLLKKDWNKIKELVMSSEIDPRELNKYFWNKALETQNLKILQLTCRNEKDISWGSDGRIVFVTSLIEMVK